MPGGYIPGNYDAATNTYNVFWYKKGFACANGLFRVRWYIPFKKHGLCDTSGRIIIPVRYDNIGDINSNGLIRVKMKDKFGVINVNNQVVVPCKWPLIKIKDNYLLTYDSANYTGDSRRVQALDLSGKPIFPESRMKCIVDYYVNEYNTNPFLIAINDSHSFIYFFESKRLLTKPVVLKAYHHLGQKAKMAHVMIAEGNADSSKSVYGLMNKEGTFLLGFDHDFVESTINDLFIVQKQNLFGLYDAKVKEWVLPIKYQGGGISVKLDGNLIGIKNKKKFRYMDRNGTVILSEKIYIGDYNNEVVNYYQNHKPFHLIYDPAKGRFYWYEGLKNVNKH